MTPLEPRLVKKLAPPLTEIVNTTSAMSLLYEAISAIISGGMLSSGPQADTLAVLCVNKLHTFLEESDQNRITYNMPVANDSEICGTSGSCENYFHTCGFGI